MKKLLLAVVSLAGAFAWSAENLVPESHRSFKLVQQTPGKMNMRYIQVNVPSKYEGITITAEVKYTDVVRGDKNWFDARVMSNWIDANSQKKSGGPVIGGWKGTKDWFPVKKVVKVDPGAAGIALMPCLFNVKGGSL